jgi:hypothetical protein
MTTKQQFIINDSVLLFEINHSYTRQNAHAYITQTFCSRTMTGAIYQSIHTEKISKIIPAYKSCFKKFIY